MEHETAATIFAFAAHSFLQNDEGIIVHYQNKGYIVWKKYHNGDTDILIDQDDKYNNYNHLQKVWVCANGEITDNA